MSVDVTHNYAKNKCQKLLVVHTACIDGHVTTMYLFSESVHSSAFGRRGGSCESGSDTTRCRELQEESRLSGQGTNIW